MLTILALLVTIGVAADEPADGKYALPDSGFTLVAPGWHMSRWSDWDFKGRSADGDVFATAWSTSYQLVLDDATAAALAQAWKQKLEEEEHATDVKVGAVRIEQAGGNPRVRAELSFSTSGGVSGVYDVAAFATRGLVAQVSTMATASHADRARAALDKLLGDVAITAAPAAIGAPEELTTAEGKVVLPTGWRAPLDAEGAEVAALFGKTGAKDPKVCAAAIHPRVGGEADVMLLCPDPGAGGILDESSFDDESTLFSQRVFGKAAAKLGHPEAVPRGEDNLAILLHANEGLWVGGIPLSTGEEIVWVSGRAEDDVPLGDVEKAVLKDLVLADAVTPNPSFPALMIHRLTYQKTHPTVLIPGAILLGILGFIVRMILKGSPSADSDAGEMY